jgi:hypothetical protein
LNQHLKLKHPHRLNTEPIQTGADTALDSAHDERG